MRYIAFILLTSLFCFTSCDGKHRGFETNKQKFENSNLSISSIKFDKYVPEYYSESITDTILSSGINVKVAYYTIDKEIILKQERSDAKIVNTHYRAFQSEIKVFQNDNLLFKDIIDVSDFASLNDEIFWKNAVLQYVWFDEPTNNYSTKLSFNCSFKDVSTNTYKAYKIHFNNLGDRNIELVETS